ncbi:uncharacterized protein PHACADRAFT_265667 [Phanerochaete carnosa HHB-10118-sp]|uniref:Uncharacterized protein n=1 Tax=Phanerochaete carnosa (strain HHB-10118-sp) TaxID=650164 RepID=K5WI59_PHACS|nr:uncharacterized protein PHACADRAFT_265667 [Phanerochaete carnosa HHB-10118-sp]EKM49907.1 hypothetical protein PHACADRAFT_265667 [Phanerochaete carnosa HHB-10118-sp]
MYGPDRSSKLSLRASVHSAGARSCRHQCAEGARRRGASVSATGKSSLIDELGGKLWLVALVHLS